MEQESREEQERGQKDMRVERRGEERGEKTKTKLPIVTIDVNKYVLKFVLQSSVILFNIFK